MSLVVFLYLQTESAGNAEASLTTGALCTYSLISLCTCILGTHVKATWLSSKSVRASSLEHMERINPGSEFTSHLTHLQLSSSDLDGRRRLRLISR